jgi:zinc protease
VAKEARSTQEQLKENFFWAGYLASSSQNKENPDQILTHVNSLEQVTVQSTKDAANKYLSGKNYYQTGTDARENRKEIVFLSGI